MRNLRCALAFVIPALMPMVTAAATITEPFSLSIPSMTGLNTTPFAEFSPAIGTLRGIMATLTGPATVSVLGGVGQNLTVLLRLPSNQPIPGAEQAFFSPGGNVTFDIRGTDISAADLAGLTGTGTTSLSLETFASVGGSITTATLNGNITYTYTPAAIPEPASLTLLGVGLLALAGWMEKRPRRRREGAVQS